MNAGDATCGNPTKKANPGLLRIRQNLTMLAGFVIIMSGAVACALMSW